MAPTVPPHLAGRQKKQVLVVAQQKGDKAKQDPDFLL